MIINVWAGVLSTGDLRNEGEPKLTKWSVSGMELQVVEACEGSLT